MSPHGQMRRLGEYHYTFEGNPLILFIFFTKPLRNYTIKSRIPNHSFVLVGDMGGLGRSSIQGVKCFFLPIVLGALDHLGSSGK